MLSVGAARRGGPPGCRARRRCEKKFQNGSLRFARGAETRHTHPPGTPAGTATSTCLTCGRAHTPAAPRPRPAGRPAFSFTFSTFKTVRCRWSVRTFRTPDRDTPHRAVYSTHDSESETTRVDALILGLSNWVRPRAKTHSVWHIGSTQHTAESAELRTELGGRVTTDIRSSSVLATCGAVCLCAVGWSTPHVVARDQASRQQKPICDGGCGSWTMWHSLAFCTTAWNSHLLDAPRSHPMERAMCSPPAMSSWHRHGW